jgi:hypothetical protein
VTTELLLNVLNAEHPDSLGIGDWNDLLSAIENKKCTPVIGAGACAGTLPMGRDIARDWAARFAYPFQDVENLPRVAQFLATEMSPMFVTTQLQEIFKKAAVPNFDNVNEPHRVLADLALPIYLTTNYDDFMYRSLARRLPEASIRRVACQWYQLGYQPGSKRQWRPSNAQTNPTPETPLVFHLHGDLRALDSIVLTEDDYLDFLVALANEPRLLPASIEGAFSSSSLLFMGYSLEDINFKVVWRKVLSYLLRNKRNKHVSVQIGPRANESTAEMLQRATLQRAFLEKQLGVQGVRIFWGTCEQFTAKLRDKMERWKATPNAA